MASSPLYAARFSQPTGRLRRGRVIVALQASDIFRPHWDGEVARANLRDAAVQLVHCATNYLPRNFWGGIFSVDLSHTAIGSGGVFEQHRVVCAHRFSFWFGNFFTGIAHRSLFDVWWHFVRGDFLHVAGADRAEVRHDSGAFARHVSCLRPAARPWMVALFHLAAFQAHAARSD